MSIKTNHKNGTMLVLLFKAIIICCAFAAFGRDQAWDQDHDDHTPIDSEYPYDSGGDSDDGGDSGGDGGDDEDDEGEEDDGEDDGPDDDEEDDCNCENKGSPFLLNTGRVNEAVEDMYLPGVGPQLHIKRTFNGADISDGIMGNGWYFFYGKSITLLKNSQGTEYLFIRWKNGQKFRLKKVFGGYAGIKGKPKPSFKVKDTKDGGWRITESDNSLAYVFNSDGSLVEMVDNNDLSITISHTSDGCPDTIYNASGHYCSFTYGTNGKVASISDNFDRDIRYAYDSDGNLTKVTYWDDAEITYGYDSLGRLITKTDFAGTVVWEVSYDEQGRVRTFREQGLLYTVTYYDGYLRERDSLGRTTEIHYNDRGVVTKRIYPDNSSIERKPNPVFGDAVDWWEDERGNRYKYTYDRDGNLLQFIDPLGNITTWKYDFKGRKIQETRPDGVVRQWEYDDNGNATRIISAKSRKDEVVQTYEYNDDGLVTSYTNPVGSSSELTYDDYGNLIKKVSVTGEVFSWTYDDFGRMTSATDADSSVTYFGYDERGRKNLSVNALGDTMSWTYDINGNVTAKVDYVGDTIHYGYDKYSRKIYQINPAGDTTHYTYDWYGMVIREQRPGQRPVYYKYDYRHRRTEEIRKVGEDTLASNSYADSDDHVYRTQYDAAGNITRETKPDGAYVNYTYDALNRIKEKTVGYGLKTTYYYDAMGNDTLQEISNGNFIRKEYDANGNVIRISDSLGVLSETKYNDLSRPVAVTIPGKGTQFTEYNAAGKKIREYDSSGMEVVYFYNSKGKLTRRVDSSGVVLSYGYDVLGRMIWQSSFPGDTVRYTYDKNSRITKIVDTSGLVSRYEYDNLGRMTVSVTPDSGEKAFEYTKSGRKAKETYPDGTEISFTYDDLGRVVTRLVDGVVVDSFAYDKGNRIVEAINDISQVSLTYTSSGKLNKSVQKIEDSTYTVSYSYGSYDLNQTITYPNAKRLVSYYDLRYRIKACRWSNYYYDTLAHFDYTGLSLAQKRFDNGIRGDITTKHGRVTSLVYSDTAGTSLPSFRYRYNRGGLRTGSENTHNSSMSESFTYDKGRRLIQYNRGVMNSSGEITNAGFSNSWVLDERGNWLSFDNDGATDTRTYNGVNEITSSDAFTVNYTENGALSKIGGLNLTWNNSQQLSGAGGATYGYDALGRRIIKNLADGSGTTVHYVYDKNQLIYQNDSEGTEKWYTYGAYIDEVLTMEDDSTKLYYLHDAQYSVIALADTGGRIVESYQYTPYGEITIYDSSFSEVTASQIGNSFTYTGRYHDSESGLYYFRARYYSSKTGSFLSRDPMGYVDGYNLYRNYFVVNNTDPTGMAVCEQLTLNTPEFSVSKDVGPVSLGAGVKVEGYIKKCRTCCAEGTARAGQWVTESEAGISITVTGNASAKSWGTKISISEDTYIDVFAGIKIEGGVKASLTGKLNSNNCNNKPLSGSICGKGEGYITVTGGAEAKLVVEETWFGKKIDVSTALAATLAGTGRLTIELCYVCGGGESCKMGPVNVCVSADVKATFSAFLFSYEWTLWKTRDDICMPFFQ